MATAEKAGTVKRPVEIPGEALTLTAAQCAALVQVGKSTWYRLYHRGKTPERLPLDGDARWGREEVLAWVKAGCPPRAKWNQMKGGRR